MAHPDPVIQTKCLSSLTKVFSDENVADEAYVRGTALGNEVYSFQIAYHSNRLLKGMKVRLESDLAEHISLYSVGLAPSELPWVNRHDDNYLRTTPGLYPDPLYPLEQIGETVQSKKEVEAIALPGQWRSIWVSVHLSDAVSPGEYPISFVMETNEGEVLGSERFDLEVLPAMLPKQTLIHTEWFHTDCLVTYYDIDVFSDKYWSLVQSYVKTAVQHGINTILTPLFTPPLDTAVGGERPTVQLVGVEKNGDQYTFDFSKLDQWIDLCQEQGVEKFEFSHLFTQWGANHAPKIIATEAGEVKKIFGWETEAAGVAYRNFLDQFLPEIKQFVYDRQLQDRVFFHVSDEPREEHLEQYEKVSAIVRHHLDEFPIIDALSNYALYEQGAVKNPIPSNNHIEPFLENNVKPLWTYYCVSQHVEVSNRFFSMPSARNRIIGAQLYKFDIDGFLHWGYNFWNSQFSIAPIDPFKVTDAGQAFPSGDAFLVYPGEDGPIESIRMKVFYEALQDLRALQLLESYIGKEAVVELLEDGIERPITFKEYPKDMGWLLSKRELVNQKIKEYQQK